MNQLLPIGSVVKLNRSDYAAFMIVGYYPQRTDGEVFEYFAVSWPSGFDGMDVHWMFNGQDIVEVIHTGYADQETKALLEKIPLLMEAADTLQKEILDDDNQRTDFDQLEKDSHQDNSDISVFHLE